MASHWLSCWVSHWLGLLLGNKEVFPPPAGVGCGWAACLGDQDSFFLVVLSLVTQSCPTLCDSKDCSPPGSSVCEVLQARILESGLPFPSPGDLLDQMLPLQGPGFPRNLLSNRHHSQPPCTYGTTIQPQNKE